MKEPTEVKLMAGFASGAPVHEMVPAFKIGANRYEIAASPGFAPGVARGDVIELCEHEATGYRILERGGNVCIQLYFRECSTAMRTQLEEYVNAIGGLLDSGFDSSAGHAIIFSVPVSSGFLAMQNLMERISSEFALDRWMYGNVYSTEDGVTPLNWWLH